MHPPHLPPGAVVVGVDGSRDAERALGWAARQAALERRPLALLHGLDATTPQRDPVWLVLAGVDPGPFAAALRDGAETLLRRARERVESLAPGVSCTTAVADADARAALVEASRSAHLVVLGSRGLGPLRTPILGSVSASVARRAHCPVVVCRPATKDHAAAGGPSVEPSEVVVGCDAGRSSRVAVELAFRQASVYGVRLRVVHCFWDALAALHGSALVEPGGPDDDEEARLVLAEVVAGMSEKYPDVRVSTEARRGLVDECLAHDVDRDALVVVGRSHDVRWGRHLSTALSVLEQSHTVVVVVPERAPAP